MNWQDQRDELVEMLRVTVEDLERERKLVDTLKAELGRCIEWQADARARLAAQQPVIDATEEYVEIGGKWSHNELVRAVDAYRAASESVEADTPAEPGEAPGRALLREVLDTLGMAGTRDWDDVLNVLRCWRKQREVAGTPAEPDAAEVAALLRACAAGRREYAENAAPHAVETLAQEAATFDTAAALVEGNYAPLYGLLPSWRWTDAMEARVRGWRGTATTWADVATIAGAAPEREVADTPTEPSSYRLRSETWDGDSCGGCGRAPVEHCPSCRRCGANEHDVDWLVTLAEERES